MSADKSYNGWSNYETWAVKLWMDNEYATYQDSRELAREVVEHPEVYGRGTYDLALILRERSDQDRPELGASVWSDLLSSALSEVEWHEIAESLIEEIKGE